MIWWMQLRRDDDIYANIDLALLAEDEGEAEKSAKALFGRLGDLQCRTNRQP